MRQLDYFTILNVPFSFVERKQHVPVSYLPEFRLAELLLVLSKCCRANKSSIMKLHIFNWALRDKENRVKFMRYMSEQLRPQDIIMRYDPSLNRTIDIALGEFLIERIQGNKVQLTNKGRKVVADLERVKCLKEEKKFCNEIGKKLTDTKVKQLVQGVRGV